MTTPQRTRTELAMSARVHRATQRRRLVLIAGTDLDTAPIPRQLDAAELAAQLKARHRTRTALRVTWWLVALVVVLFYGVPTGAAMGWWGS